MNRYLAVVLAILFASISVASACTAAATDGIDFTLRPDRHGQKIEATFEQGGRGHNHTWSSDFASSELIGLDVAGFRSGASVPIRFAIVREAGRLDCAGTGARSFAAGNCGFTADPAFSRLLESRGIGRPTGDESFSMMAVGVRRELIDTVAAAHYPTPSIDDLIAMTAVGADARYIAELSRLGYRPKSIDSLVQFRALNITPQYIGEFARIGYANVPADDLVQLKALGVTPDYVLEFERAGYRHLPVDTLVQFKALDITPDFARWAQRQRGSAPDSDDLVQMKVLGERR